MFSEIECVRVTRVFFYPCIRVRISSVYDLVAALARCLANMAFLMFVWGEEESGVGERPTLVRRVTREWFLGTGAGLVASKSGSQRNQNDQNQGDHKHLNSCSFFKTRLICIRYECFSVFRFRVPLSDTYFTVVCKT